MAKTVENETLCIKVLVMTIAFGGQLHKAQLTVQYIKEGECNQTTQ